MLKNECESLAASSINAVIQMASKKWKNDLKEILRGDKSVVNYKSVPIEIPSRNVRLSKSDNGNYNAVLTLFSGKYKKNGKVDSTSVGVLLGCQKRKSMKEILNRLVGGEYKLGACKVNREKNKWYLIVTYSFEKESCFNLDPNKVMGIDMGIVHAAYFTFNKGYNRGKIEGGEIDSFRKRVEGRRLSMLKQGKYSTRNGRGRNHILKPTEILRGKIDKFKNATNHKYANHIVQEALTNKCATIQMEDLSGISTDNTFLKSWTYFDLQTKIENQANAVGIEVVKINPKYTSQRCSKCGIIDKENREDQATFKCKHCNFKTNADYNAAKNISLQNIEKIIKEQAEVQKLSY